MSSTTMNPANEITAVTTVTTAAQTAAHKIITAYRAFQETRAQWKRQARARRELATMGRREMAQVGISVCDVENEIRKPFWSKISDMRRIDF